MEQAGDEAGDADWADALHRARCHAPFLARGLERFPAVAEALELGHGEEALQRARAAGEGSGSVAVALRRERSALALALAIGDLAGAFPLERVMAELSELADRALDEAILHAIDRRVEGAGATGFIALALGKHGARELNYSSDIDPILLYDPETLPRRPRDEPGEAAQRYARDIVRLLSDATAEGYVFRVDLRLRPASEVSPLAIGVSSALTHYESSAIAWERAAFIRARAAAGDIVAGARFLAAIAPFVWRRSLDFGAIAEVERLAARIRAGNSGPTAPGPGYNVKLGRGGIREIEFFAQTHQLIHGGRDPSLQVSGTRAALDALARAGIIGADVATELGDGYDRLRVVEHRLQMVEDRQTHTLPDGEALDGVARLDGLADGAALLAELSQLTAGVARHFDGLIEPGGETVACPTSAGRNALVDRARSLGFPDPERTAARIESWRDGRFACLRSDAALAAFEAVLPDLLDALAAADDPDRALTRWEKLLAGMPTAINLLRLLEARPALLDQLVSILTLTPVLADELARRPALMDALIDRTALELPGSVLRLCDRMRRGGSADYERALDAIRIVTGETRFALGVQLIEAAQDPLDVGAALSRTAEAALQVAHEAACAQFEAVHGRIEGGELLVVGLGRFGGGALTHASDLDIVYLFTGSHDAQSDGARPLGATLYFNRLAQRVGAALSVPTAQGALYEVDTRLRPQGTQGPLAASVQSFARYQREDAWTWEHMALTRARVLVGSVQGREALGGVIHTVLHRERDAQTLREDVLKMRGEMARHKPPRGELDAKLARGGLIDAEFMIHYLQLRHRTAFDPDLGQAIAALVGDGLLSGDAIPAYDLMTRMIVSVGLFAPDQQRPHPAAAAALARSCRVDDYDALLQAFGQARQTMRREWQRVFGEKLEELR